MTGRRLLGIMPGLERISAVLDCLGDPERRLGATILIAGTNGKGAVAAFCHALSVAAGFKTALYTSPHLVSVGERMRVNDTQISAGELDESLDRVLRAEDDTGVTLTGFELVTAVAFEAFARHRPERTILEVGMGGRWDATNVIEPDVSVITPIGMDHVSYLGDTYEKIALEKAGILRAGSPYVVATMNPEAATAVATAGRSLGAQAWLEGREFRAARGPSGFDYESRFRTLSGLSLGLPGAFQAQNAATAITAVDLLDSGAAPHDAVAAGLANTRWPGRFDLRSVNGSPILFDGAHNPEGATALAQAFSDRFSGTTDVLLALKADKPAQSIVDALAPLARAFVITRAPDVESHNPEQIARLVPRHIDVHVEPDPACALSRLLSLSPVPGGIPKLCCGSLYLVGYCFKMLGLAPTE